jgi:hypothetical protein
VFDRTYIRTYSESGDLVFNPHYDGEGRVWGIDVLLQKLHSRYWDGWLAYSYNWAKYKDPKRDDTDIGPPGRNVWHFPEYHRFHTLNLILNVKPTPKFNIYTRFGIASGIQQPKYTKAAPESHPVYVVEEDKFIEKYIIPSVPNKNNRTTPELPLDVKFSLFGGKKDGKTRWELYAAVENVLSLWYSAKGNKTYNEYTGREDTGDDAANYGFPVPIPSIGFKISY